MNDFEDDYVFDTEEPIVAPDAPKSFEVALAHLRSNTPKWTDKHQAIAEKVYKANGYKELHDLLSVSYDRNAYAPLVLGTLWNPIFVGNNHALLENLIVYLVKRIWAMEYVLPGEATITTLAEYPTAHTLPVLWVSKMPVAAQRKIASNGHRNQRARLARRPELAKKIANVLFKTGSYEVYASLAANPVTPPYVLAGLASEGDTTIISRLALRLDLPSVAWKELAESRSNLVLNILSRNPTCPDEYRTFAGLNVIN